MRKTKQKQTRKQTQKQIALALREKRGHGGKRRGAGRPKRSTRVAHRKRAAHNPNHALHINFRVLREIGDLRELKRVRAIEEALGEGCNRFGFRVIHYTIQSTHVASALRGDRQRCNHFRHQRIEGPRGAQAQHASRT